MERPAEFRHQGESARPVDGRLESYDPGSSRELPAARGRRRTDQKHRPNAARQRLLSDVSQEEVPPPSGAVRAQHDEIRVDFVGVACQFLGDTSNTGPVGVNVHGRSSPPELRGPFFQVPPGLFQVCEVRLSVDRPRRPGFKDVEERDPRTPGGGDLGSSGERGLRETGSIQRHENPWSRNEDAWSRHLALPKKTSTSR